MLTVKYFKHLESVLALKKDVKISKKIQRISLGYLQKFLGSNIFKIKDS